MRYPPADREPVTDLLHGQRVPDPYRWLEDPGGHRTRAWLAAQDELWRAHAGGLTSRAWFRERCAALADTGDVEAPVWRGDRRFHTRRAPGREHPVLHTALGAGPERALLDPGTLDPTGLTTLDAWHPDPTGRLLAYQTSTGGTEEAELRVLDVATGAVVDGPIDRCRYSPVAWLPDGAGFYYVRATGPDGARRVHLHRFGAPADADPVVFTAGDDPAVGYGLGISHDGRWLAVSASPGTAPRNDVWLADLAYGDPAVPRFRPVLRGRDARAVPLVGHDGRMLVVTDLDAPRVRLCVADPADPARWTELLPEDPAAVLADVALLDGPEPGRPVLLVARLRDAAGELAVHDAATGERLADVPLPGRGTVGALSTRPGGGHEAWFTYTDVATPPTVWRYDARTGETTPWAAPPGHLTVPPVRTRQAVAVSADGTPVRMTVIDRPGDHGPRPTILYGYGGFGMPLVPSYAADALAWVEAGGVLAIAHLRGGGEDGLHSHRAGTLDRKQDVFDDFLAAARALVDDGWTTPDRLAVWGESNGGLLVGAAVTQRPDLFAAAVCVAPLLDMVRYERSGMGAAWREEYGTVTDPAQFACLYGYSPYHRVRPGTDYPAVLFATFGGDTRVDPLHARKTCAAMQWATAGTRPVLLRHEERVGHGARSAARGLDLAADLLAFAAAHTGLRAGPAPAGGPPGPVAERTAPGQRFSG
ncbi:prolyl oligopeptidase family serine peptidase [Actinomadura kijaniata]|uniref:prolyl oligopeptidase family serine peptidase n=1 Tax=Actinomadura kijaniata TaxID=46161 RepID=UPI003F1A8CAE